MPKAGRNSDEAFLAKRKGTVKKVEHILLELESDSEQKTELLGGILAKRLKKGDFVALSGDLGAGKTAFVRGMCRQFCPEARVCSPTYTVMRLYKGGACPFYHFDFYRISSPEDLESVGFYDCDGVIAAEWCEKAPWGLPEKYYQVQILKTGETTRRIRITSVLPEEEKENEARQENAGE